MQNADGFSLTRQTMWRVVVIAATALVLWGLFKLQLLFGILRYIDPVARYVLIAAALATLFEALRRRRLLRGINPASRPAIFDSTTAAIAALSVIIALCFLALMINWSNGGTRDYSAIGGVIPYSDAAGYFEGAERLIHEQKLTAWTERRPLNAAFLAARLILTDNNFFSAIILQALLAAVALFLATAAIFQTHGKASAVWFFAISFAFVSCCLHRTLSEPLGISLGLIAFAMLWSGIANRSPGQYAFGTFALALALLARAGAMFALPAAVLFAIYLFRESRQRQLKALLATLAALACAWLVNSAIVHLYGMAEGTLLSNFSYVIYGLSQGGTNWTQGLKDFPQLASATDAEIARFLYQKAIENILAKPYLLLWGLTKSLVQAIGLFPGHILRLLADGSDGGSFSRSAHVTIAAILILPLMGYSAFKFFRTHMDRQDGFQIFLLVQILAFTASLPFFYLDGDIRLTAATFPLTAAVMALALSALTSAKRTNEHAGISSNVSIAASIVTAIVVAASLAAPKINRLVSPLPIIAAAQCGANREELRVRIGDGSAHINIVDDATPGSWAPNIRQADFVVSNVNEVRDEILAIPKPATILLAFDANSKALRQIVGPAGFADGAASWISLCAEPLRGQAFTHRTGPR